MVYGLKISVSERFQLLLDRRRCLSDDFIMRHRGWDLISVMISVFYLLYKRVLISRVNLVKMDIENQS